MLGKLIGDANVTNSRLPSLIINTLFTRYPPKTKPTKKPDRTQDRTRNLQKRNKKGAIDLSTMSPDHQADEQLNWAVLSTFQLILNAFLECLGC